MAAITVTPANVIKGTNAATETGISGATIVAGDVVYKKASDSKYYLADALAASVSTNAEIDNAVGIALNAGSASQPLTIQKSGQITIGGTVAVGENYVLDIVVGQIIPEADATSNNYVTNIGRGISATVIDLAIKASNIAHA